MLDIVFIAATVLFFAASIGYVYFCEKVRWDDHAPRIRFDACHLRFADDLPRLRAVTSGEVL